MAKKKTTKKKTLKAVKKSITKKATKKGAKKTLNTKTPASLVSTKPSKQYRSVSIGDVIPNFSLPSTSGATFDLNHYRGQKVVLYFYPKDSTPGCTIEGNDFSRLLPQFHARNAVVFGISRDSLKSHENFKCNQNFQFELLSDKDEAACKIFDVIQEKNMYGKMVLGIERSTFIISEKGELQKEWRKVKVEGHADEVLQNL